MSDEESSLEGKTKSTQESVAQSILRRFPLATLNAVENRSGTIYELYFQDKLVLRLDAKGARYFFPSRRKRMVRWEKISTFGLPRVIEYILRDLAEADFQAVSCKIETSVARSTFSIPRRRAPYAVAKSFNSEITIFGGMRVIF